jgi:hypothetical protein
MATRFYLASSGTAAASPAFSAAWGATSQAVRLPASTAKTNTSVVDTANISTESADLINVLVAQFVSAETFGAAGTVGGGTLSAVVAARQNATGVDAWLQIIATVVSGDGSTVRGTLYAGSTHTAPSATVGAQNEEFTTSTIEASRIWDSVPVSSVSVQEGDRIILEVGYRCDSDAIRNARLTIGDAIATSDHDLVSGTSTALVPWVEFSTDLFTAATDPSGVLEAALPAVTATLAGTYTAPGAGPVGDLSATLPTVTASLSGSYVAPVVTTPIGDFAASLPVVTATLSGSYVAPVGAIPLGSLAATLPAFTASLSGTYTLGFTDSSDTFNNDGYSYTGTSRVFYEAPIAEPPPTIVREKVKRVHQSLPAPTVVNGRPTW